MVFMRVIGSFEKPTAVAVMAKNGLIHFAGSTDTEEGRSELMHDCLSPAELVVKTNCYVRENADTTFVLSVDTTSPDGKTVTIRLPDSVILSAAYRPSREGMTVLEQVNEVRLAWLKDSEVYLKPGS